MKLSSLSLLLCAALSFGLVACTEEEQTQQAPLNPPPSNSAPKITASAPPTVSTQEDNPQLAVLMDTACGCTTKDCATVVLNQFVVLAKSSPTQYPEKQQQQFMDCVVNAGIAPSEFITKFRQAMQ